MSKKKKPTNFLEALKKWKERKTRIALEEAEKEITDDRTENEEKIIGILSNIDLKVSPIPQEKKDYKTNPDQPFGDLELAAKVLPQMIRTTDAFPVDTKKLDTILLGIAEEFNNAVRNGDTRAAFAAKAALVKGVKDYRLRIPSIKGKERAEIYLEKVCEQMKTWLALIAEASRIDQYNKNPELKQKTEESLKAKEDEEAKEKKWLDRNNPKIAEYAKAIDFWRDMSAAEVPPAKLTPIQKEVRDHFTELFFLQSLHNFNEWLYDKEKQVLQILESRYDMLETATHRVIIDEDPDKCKLFEEAMELVAKTLNEQDLLLSESHDAISKINAMLDSRTSSEGQIAAVAAVNKMANIAVERMKTEQNNNVLSFKEGYDDAMRILGMRTDEEQQKYEQEQMKQNEELNKAYEDSLRNGQMQNTEQHTAEEHIHNDDFDDDE